MIGTVDTILLHADYFVLMFFRISGLVISSPIFGRISIPQRVKIGLSLAITFLLFTVYPQTEDIVYSSLIGYVLICVTEILLGISLSFVTNMFLTLVFTAGQKIDMQIGFGMVNVYDVQNRTQMPMMGTVLNILLLLVFFSVDGHLRLIDIMRLTLEKLPIGAAVISPEIAWVALELFSLSFTLGIMVAMPIIASGLTLEIIFGMLMRAVPQLHMFVVGIPLKILIGLFVFATLLPVFSGYSDRIFTEMFIGMEKMFTAFTGVS